MKIMLAAIALMLSVPLLGLADQSLPPGRGLRRGISQNPPPSTQPDADLEAAMKFMDSVSPYKAAALRNLTSRPLARLQTQVVQKWRNYELLNEKYPDLAAFALQRIRIEDDIYKWQTEYRHTAATRPVSTSDIQEFRTPIKKDESDLFDIDIKEQKVRIANLNTLLDQEQKKLDALNALNKDRDQTIENRTDQLLEPPHHHLGGHTEGPDRGEGHPGNAGLPSTPDN